MQNPYSLFIKRQRPWGFLKQKFDTFWKINKQKWKQILDIASSSKSQNPKLPSSD